MGTRASFCCYFPELSNDIILPPPRLEERLDSLAFSTQIERQSTGACLGNMKQRSNKVTTPSHEGRTRIPSCVCLTECVMSSKGCPVFSAAVMRLFWERKKKAEVENTPFKNEMSVKAFSFFLPHHHERLSTIEHETTVIQGLHFIHALVYVPMYSY